MEGCITAELSMFLVADTIEVDKRSISLIYLRQLWEKTRNKHLEDQGHNKDSYRKVCSFLQHICSDGCQMELIFC